MVRAPRRLRSEEGVDVNHDYTAPVLLTEHGALTSRRVSYCLQCGVLRQEIANARSGRASFLYAFTQPKDETISHVDEPACTLAPERRTMPRTRVFIDLDNGGLSVRRPGAILAALGEPLHRDEWRKLTDAAGLLHVSRYRPVEAGKRTADLYGPVPIAWCGVPLGLVSWTTIGLLGAPDRYEEGDAICTGCWDKSAPTRKRDRARAPMLP
jgi:hypothetical protein